MYRNEPKFSDLGYGKVCSLLLYQNVGQSKDQAMPIVCNVNTVIIINVF
jgi:hypothetical protein